MRRFISGFPNALPSVGILILRLGNGLYCLVHCCVLCGVAPSFDGALQLASIGAGCFILLGFATRIAAGIGVLVSLGTIAPLETHILIATTYLSLMLLGPGAWSVDARLYGRRRVDLNSL